MLYYSIMTLSNEQLSEIWHFPWPVIDVLIGGKSAVDLPSLKISNLKEATDFIESYGYDLNDEDDQCVLHSVIIEALNFIETRLMPEEWSDGLIPPQEILLCDDPRYLLLWASRIKPEEQIKCAWACAILRVMHTIIHTQNLPKPVDLEYVKNQILSRFEEHIFHDDQGNLCFGKKDNFIFLDRVDFKYEKSRDSVILKLLQKTANVAETIYDLIGVRIVTERFCDIMMVVKYLRVFYMVNFPNCIPSRARNNLIDVERFHNQISALRCMLGANTITPEEFDNMLSKLESPANITETKNPHSSPTYRSIQLTCRQQITLPNPAFGWFDRLNDIANRPSTLPSHQSLLKELSFLIKGWNQVRENRSVSFLYPFEVQIMDKETYQANHLGDASHDHYKLTQVKAARKRVLKEVFRLHGKQI